MEITIQVNLPDTLVAEAEARGCLNPQRLAQLIAREVTSVAARKAAVASSLCCDPGAAMSMDQLQHLVDELRAEHATRESTL